MEGGNGGESAAEAGVEAGVTRGGGRVGGNRGERFERDLEGLGVGGKNGSYSEDFGRAGEKVEWEGR